MNTIYSEAFKDICEEVFNMGRNEAQKAALEKGRNEGALYGKRSMACYLAQMGISIKLIAQAADVGEKLVKQWILEGVPRMQNGEFSDFEDVHYRVTIRVGNDEYNLDADAFYDNTNTLPHNMESILTNYYREILCGTKFGPKGWVSADENQYQIYLRAHAAFAEADREKWGYVCDVLHGDDFLLTSFRCTQSAIFEDRLERDIKIGNVVDRHVCTFLSDCLRAYVLQGRWHVEENRLWFGPDDCEVFPSWEITPTTNDLEFWFMPDWRLRTYDNLSRLIKLEKNKLAIYTDDTNFYLPDMKTIRKLCPITINYGDSVADVLARIHK